MKYAAEEMHKIMQKKQYQAKKNAQLILFGYELGTQAGIHQLFYSIIILLAIAITLSILYKQIIASKDGKEQ